MENKKWYKRISTCFWFLLASMPIWLSVIELMLSYLIHTDSLSLTDIQSLFTDNNFNDRFISNTSFFTNYTPSVLNTAYDDLFTNLNISTASAWGVAFAWFTWTYFLHLVVDVIVWLPKLFHKWLDRWCD